MPSGIYFRSPELLARITERIKKVPKFVKHTDESREKIRLKRMERLKKLGYINTPETCKKIALAQIGKKRKPWSVEHKRKLSNLTKGDKHWNWQGGRYTEQQKVRHSLGYKLWKDEIFKRDDYTCKLCGKRGGNIQADHIKPFAYFPELRLDLNNGRTLCEPCHKKTDTYGKRVKKYYDTQTTKVN